LSGELTRGALLFKEFVGKRIIALGLWLIDVSKGQGSKLFSGALLAEQSAERLGVGFDVLLFAESLQENV